MKHNLSEDCQLKFKEILKLAKKFSENPIDNEIITIQLYFIRDTIGEVATKFPINLNNIRDLLNRPEFKIENFISLKANIPLPETAKNILTNCKDIKTCGFHIRHKAIAMHNAGIHRRRFSVNFDPSTIVNDDENINFLRHSYRKRAHVESSSISSMRSPFVNYTFILKDFHSDWILPEKFISYISKLEYFTRDLDKWFFLYNNVRKFYHLDSTDEPLLQFESFICKKISETIERVIEGEIKVQNIINERSLIYHQMISWPEIEDYQIASDHNTFDLWQALHQWLEMLEIGYDKIIGIFLQYLEPLLDAIQIQRINRVSETKNMT